MKLKFDCEGKGKQKHRRSLLLRLMLPAILLGSAHRAMAQQDPIYTQYMHTVLVVNPAYAMVGDHAEVVAVSRNQWTGIEGAPVTSSLSAQLPINLFNSGVGVSFLTDRVGPIRQNGAYADYAYRVRVSRHGFLSLGLKAGFNFYKADFTGMELNQANDPEFLENVSRRFLPNVGVGAFYYTDRFFVSLAAPKLITNKINEQGYSSQFSSREQVHWFAMAGYVFPLSDQVQFKPYVQVGVVHDAPATIDLAAHFLFFDRFWLGANWRLGNEAGAMAQFYLTPNFKIGYAYDLSANDLHAFNRGTHEILLSYTFNTHRLKCVSPRYF